MSTKRTVSTLVSTRFFFDDSVESGFPVDRHDHLRQVVTSNVDVIAHRFCMVHLLRSSLCTLTSHLRLSRLEFAYKTTLRTRVIFSNNLSPRWSRRRWPISTHLPLGHVPRFSCQKLVQCCSGLHSIFVPSAASLWSTNSRCRILNMNCQSCQCRDVFRFLISRTATGSCHWIDSHNSASRLSRLMESLSVQWWLTTIFVLSHASLIFEDSIISNCVCANAPHLPPLSADVSKSCRLKGYPSTQDALMVFDKYPSHKLALTSSNLFARCSGCVLPYRHSRRLFVLWQISWRKSMHRLANVPVLQLVVSLCKTLDGSRSVVTLFNITGMLW